jgi:hypothetical protein
MCPSLVRSPTPAHALLPAGVADMHDLDSDVMTPTFRESSQAPQNLFFLTHFPFFMT